MPGELKAVTFDWWGTLYVHREARARRLQLLSDFLRERGETVSRERLEAAYSTATGRLDREWRAGNVFLPRQWLRCVFEELGLALPSEAAAELCPMIEDAMLSEPPDLVPGAAALVADLHLASVRLGIISDTGLTVGRVMRRILDRDGILACFTAFVFSDETGVTKPHRVAFERASAQLGVPAVETTHVGDLPETDVTGAKAAGMRAVLINGVSGRADDGIADAVVGDYSELRCLCQQWRLLPSPEDPGID